MELRHRVLARARLAGAVAAGFADSAPIPPADVDSYRRWLASGCNASMEYLEKYPEVRANPALLLDGAQSILSLAFSYYQPGAPRSPLFADYALGDDYHTALRARLEPLAAWMRRLVPGSETRICIDTAPLRERLIAVRAGIGFIGLNNQLITPVGSRVFLAEILWTARVAPSRPCTQTCMECRRCIDACPGRALIGDGTLDARRCLSYLTIEHRGDLPADLRLKTRIYGCDICQDVCPHNRMAGASVIPPLQPRKTVLDLTLDQILSLTPGTYAATFRNSAIKRVKLPNLQRNAKAALE